MFKRNIHLKSIDTEFVRAGVGHQLHFHTGQTQAVAEPTSEASKLGPILSSETIEVGFVKRGPGAVKWGSNAHAQAGRYHAWPASI